MLYIVIPIHIPNIRVNDTNYNNNMLLLCIVIHCSRPESDFLLVGTDSEVWKGNFKSTLMTGSSSLPSGFNQSSHVW